MTPLSRFMLSTKAFLDVQPDQPPIFVRTTWLLVEIDEALEQATRLVTLIKIARLNNEAQTATHLTADLAVITGQLSQMSAWARDEFAKEV